MARLKLGMVGGGQGAFIGGVHRMAARLDGEWELIAGALSSDPARAKASAEEFGIARSYSDFNEMARIEAAHADGIDAVAIVTPNHMHAAPAIAFLNAGINVICDKPLAATTEDAQAIAAAAKTSKARFILTHNYTGYPMVRQAREMIARGDLGKVRVVQVEYAQDWLTEPASGKQAEWRVDPARSGVGGCVGDIGTHAFNLASYVVGEAPARLAADLQTFVPGRKVDDNIHVMLRYASGARGMLWASQVAPGNENEIQIRIYGEKGGLEWAQSNANSLRFTPFGAPAQTLTRGGANASDAGARVSRIPGGHPEGYLEAFATIYSESAALIRADQAGIAPPNGVHTPDLDDGLAGMRFIAACIRSSAKDAAWEAL